MSEPFGNKWKKYKVWPSVLGQSGGTIDHIKLNIGNPSSLQGTQGLQGLQGIGGIQGTQGTQGTQVKSKYLLNIEGKKRYRANSWLGLILNIIKGNHDRKAASAN